MSSLRPLPQKARRILELARADRAAAREAFSKQPLDAQVELVCETPVSRRAELLDLAAEPERLVPALPPAELCFTVKAVGLDDAGWILEHAAPEQIATCVDLDAWGDLAPDRARLGEWLTAFADAGEEALLRAVGALDFELLTLALQSRVQVLLQPSDDDWTPPPGAVTLDGQFHLLARDEEDDLADVVDLLRLLFQRDYWVYFRLVQAVLAESEADTEEWALRWRSGRLQDLGFPPWEEAMRVYGWLPPEQRAQLGEPGRLHAVGEWPLPIWMPRLPAGAARDPLLFRALADVPESERRALLFAFLALANAVAVADRLPLGDAETLPAAIDKAARVASAGLAHVGSARGLEPAEVLRRTTLERLFRVGASLDPSVAPPASHSAEDAGSPREVDPAGSAPDPKRT
jgi:hypothetical protein